MILVGIALYIYSEATKITTSTKLLILHGYDYLMTVIYPRFGNVLSPYHTHHQLNPVQALLCLHY